MTIDSVGLQIWEKIKESFTSAGGAIGSAFKALGDGSTNLLKNVTDSKATDTVTDGAKKVTDAVGDGAKKAADTVTDGAKKATEAIGNLFK